MAVAIILAAGGGSRMKSDVAKQYLQLRGKEILYYSLKTFQENKNIDAIILVTRKEDVDFCKASIVDKYGFNKVIEVYKGLMSAKTLPEENRDIVLIHDSARPFVTDEMIDSSIKTIKNGNSACTVGMPVKDTIKIVEQIDGKAVGIRTPDRSTLYQIQTPQTFRYDMLVSAYEKMFENENHNITDDTMIAEQYEGMLSVIIPGAYENIKITTPEDLDIAEKFIEKII